MCLLEFWLDGESFKKSFRTCYNNWILLLFKQRYAKKKQLFLEWERTWTSWSNLPISSSKKTRKQISDLSLWSARVWAAEAPLGMRVTRSLALAAHHALIYSTATGLSSLARASRSTQEPNAPDRERERATRTAATERATIYLGARLTHSLARRPPACLPVWEYAAAAAAAGVHGEREITKLM